MALGLLDHCRSAKEDFSSKAVEILQYLHEEEEDKSATLIEIRVPKSNDEKRFLGKRKKDSFCQHPISSRLMVTNDDMISNWIVH